MPKTIESSVEENESFGTKNHNPETYLGTARAKYYSHSVAEYHPGRSTFSKMVPGEMEYSLEGPWNLSGEFISAAGPGAKIRLNYHAALVQLVTSGAGQLVLTDGHGHRNTIPIPKVPGTIDLISETNPQSDTVTLEIPEGVQLYSFTFG